MMAHPPPAEAPVLLGIWAHPDDEAYLSAGTMARWTDAGGRAICCVATRGEHGIDPDDSTPATFGRRRERELRCALEVVGAELAGVLGHPDGGCDRVSAHAAVRVLTGLMVATRPERVITFGPDGITGHLDHRVVAAWTTAAWQAARRLDPMIGALHYAALTHEFAARCAARNERIGLFADLPDGPVVTADADVCAQVHLDERELDRKRAALAEHASQTEVVAATMGEADYRDWFRTESFRRPTVDELADARGMPPATRSAVPVRAFEAVPS